jgi:hypothetical protein
MKKDLLMNARSPDPDDLANDEPPPGTHETDERQRRDLKRSTPDVSAPHIPPVEKGRIRGE